MYRIEENTREESIYIRNRLTESNIDTMPYLEESTKTLCYNAKNENGEIIGGIFGEKFWNWIQVSILWIDESHKKNDIGKELLKKMEVVAHEHSCVYIQLDTFGFQALRFYQRNGYSVFGQLANPDTALTHYYLVRHIHKVSKP